MDGVCLYLSENFAFCVVFCSQICLPIFNNKEYIPWKLEVVVKKKNYRLKRVITQSDEKR